MQKTQPHQFYDPVEFDREFPLKGPGFNRPPLYPHVHNCFEIGFCHRGAGILQVENKIYFCGSGDAVFINDREFHMLRNATPGNSEWSFINLDVQSLLAGWIPAGDRAFNQDNLAGENFKNVFHDKDNPALTELTLLLIRELKEKKGNYQAISRALVWAILNKLHDMQSLTNAKLPPVRNSLPLIYPALEYIANHYHTTIEIPVLAEKCNYSLSGFRRIFKKTMGMLPVEYLTEFRLKAAAALLKNTRKPIIDIAEETGFPTLSHFNRCFKTYFHRSPRQYRSR